MFLFSLLTSFAEDRTLSGMDAFFQSGKMAKDDMVDADLPSRDAAKEFYAKYEPKEALGR